MINSFLLENMQKFYFFVKTDSIVFQIFLQTSKVRYLINFIPRANQKTFVRVKTFI